MKTSDAASIGSYKDNVALLNAFQVEQMREFERLHSIQSAELSKIDQMVAAIKREAADKGRGIEEAKGRLAAAGIPADFTVVQPPQFNPASTPNQILEMLNPITESVYRHASELPRLHLRHRGMRRDRLILPIFAAGWLFCMSLVLSSGPWAGLFYAFAGAGAASMFVRVSGGGWTFRRLGGQDYTPRRPGQVAGTGALAAFLVFGGLVFLFWGFASMPGGLMPGLVVGGAMLAMPLIRFRDVLKLDEQAPR